jgi:probable phosphoglycerate mutase
MRHGQSEANALGIIVSSPAIAIRQYGITEKGRQQVEAVIKTHKGLDKNTLIFCSDFRRTKQTAILVRKLLNAGPIHQTSKLREHFFGEWEGSSDKNYDRIWRENPKSADSIKGVESIDGVVERTTSFVAMLEKEYSGKKILLVTHGDPMKMLLLSFENKNPEKHVPISVPEATLWDVDEEKRKIERTSRK